MAHKGVPTRQIATELGVSKDTVLRDLRQPNPQPMTRAERLTHRMAQTEQAVNDVSAAVQGAVDARPGYTLTDDATAARWCAELRAAADALAELAAQFADCYPHATA